MTKCIHSSLGYLTPVEFETVWRLAHPVQTTTDELAALDSGNPNQAEHDQLQLALTQNRQSYASVLQSFEQIKLAEAQSSSGIIQQDPAVPPDAPIKAQPATVRVRVLLKLLRNRLMPLDLPAGQMRPKKQL